jgi:hypothetical protein
MKVNVRVLALVLVIVLLASVGTAAAAEKDVFGAHLSGSGAGTMSKTQGQVNFKLSGDQLEFIATVSKFNGGAPFAAHIHISSTPGGNGPPVVTLCGGGPGPAQTACGALGVLAVGTLDLGNFSITGEALMTAISENRAYVNVHTPTYPAGEIRGQID